MNCDIIKDLIPLYIDGACSDESKYAIETHLTKCESCKMHYETMSAPIEYEQKTQKVKKAHKIQLFKASILQSALFFISFLVITVGVALEAATGIDDDNGYWAKTLVIPATGFLLSLANWFFVRLYKSRDSFAFASAVTTFACICICGSWGIWHYSGFFQIALLSCGLIYINFFITIGLTAASAFLSSLYAKLLGKE